MLAQAMRPVRKLRPIRAFACPRDLKLVAGTECRNCEDYCEGYRPHKNFWIRCGYIGGGMEYAKFRADVEGNMR